MADALGAGISGIFGLLGQGLQYKYAQQLASQQNRYNIDMWKMQADYNSPQAQMNRFKAAGINPYVVASQGNAGNMNSAAEQVVPAPPDIQGALSKFGDAFNIEGLRTTIAKRKQAEADALNASTDAERNALQLFSEKNVLSKYYFYNMKEGRFERVPRDPDGVVTVRHPSAFYTNKLLAELNYLNNRAAYVGSQRSYLEPQIWMANYEKEYFPVNYWIGTASKGIKGVSDLTGMFNPSRYLMPLGKKGRQFLAPSGKVYNY